MKACCGSLIPRCKLYVALALGQFCSHSGTPDQNETMQRVINKSKLLIPTLNSHCGEFTLIHMRYPGATKGKCVYSFKVYS